MTFDWFFYIKLANELINFQKTSYIKEAYFRTSISRSYYGAFCLSRNFLERKGISLIPKDKSVHQFVIEKYRYSNNSIEREIGKKLDRLRKERNDSDYNDRKKVKSQNAVRAYNKSKKILKLLKNIKAI